MSATAGTIAAHVDEPGVGGRAIATTVIAGASEVRVGAVAFAVRAGDRYCLTGLARATSTTRSTQEQRTGCR